MARAAPAASATTPPGLDAVTANAAAKILNEAVGFTGAIADKGTGELLSVHLVGPNVTELIS